MTFRVKPKFLNINIFDFIDVLVNLYNSLINNHCFRSRHASRDNSIGRQQILAETYFLYIFVKLMKNMFVLAISQRHFSLTRKNKYK